MAVINKAPPMESTQQSALFSESVPYREQKGPGYSSDSGTDTITGIRIFIFQSNTVIFPMLFLPPVI